MSSDRSGRSMRVPEDIYEAVRTVADVENRTITAQLSMLVELGLEASGFEAVLSSVRSRPPAGMDPMFDENGEPT